MRTQDQAVRVIVSRPPVTVYPTSTLRAVAATMVEESIGAVVVRGEKPPYASGVRAEGIVSERDIVTAIAEGRDPDLTRAEDVMTMNLASAEPEAAVMSVANCMLANEIRHVPLTTDGVVHAIVSERDVLRAMVEGAADAEQ